MLARSSMLNRTAAFQDLNNPENVEPTKHRPQLTRELDLRDELKRLLLGGDVVSLDARVEESDLDTVLVHQGADERYSGEDTTYQYGSVSRAEFQNSQLKIVDTRSLLLWPLASSQMTE